MNVVDLGRGTALLLHGGWVASWALWLPLIERLQHDFRCVAYDHRGAGASTFPATTISSEALVDDVFRVMDATRLDTALIAGESLGGVTCLQAVLREPARFRGLVLSASFPQTPSRSGESTSAVSDDWTGYVEHFVDACLPEADAESLHRFGAQTLEPAGPDAALAMTHAMAGIAPALEELRVPTLVVHGRCDAIAPPAGAEELANRIPDAELVWLEDAGHVPILTRADAVADAVRDWAARHALLG